MAIWRLDQARHAATWNSGEGAYLFGGRWNSKGVRAVYCCLDPATATLEVAVHKGGRALDVTPHVLTRADIPDGSPIHVVRAESVPNHNWLQPCLPSAGQQAFGDALLAAHGCFLISSPVSAHSWNFVFDAGRSAGLIAGVEQERFALDTRLHPA
jgi:RES domain-containing protein